MWKTALTKSRKDIEVQGKPAKAALAERWNRTEASVRGAGCNQTLDPSPEALLENVGALWTSGCSEAPA